MKKSRKRVVKIDSRKRYRGGRRPYGNGDTVKNPSLYRELKAYQQAGVALWLNGKPSTSSGIANSVREETGYMRDYYIDQNNEICGISFDRIRKEKQ